MSSTARLPSSPPPSPASPATAKILRFRPALRTASFLRMAIVGPSGAGKTVTALRIAQALALPSGRVAVLDTDRGKALRYAGSSTPFGFRFDGTALTSFHPHAYRDAIRDAEREGYAALVVDSLSHAWMGEGGVLDLVDHAMKRTGGDSRSSWMEGNAAHREMMNALLTAKLHVIVTIRTKMEHVLEPGAQGKMVTARRGTTPEQQAGIAYDFDVAGVVNEAHELSFANTICTALEGRVFPKAGAEVAEILGAWLTPQEAPEVTPAQIPQAVPVPPEAPPVPAPPPSSTVLGTRSGMSVAEARAKAELDPALRAATSEEEVEALRQDAALAMPTDPGDTRKRVPSPAYLAWYQHAVKAARMRVAGRV